MTTIPHPTPVEQARAFGALAAAGHSRPDIARMTGYSTALVGKRLALLDLDNGTLDRIERGVLSANGALAAVRQYRRAAAPTQRPQPGAPATQPEPEPQASPAAADTGLDQAAVRRYVNGEDIWLTDDEYEEAYQLVVTEQGWDAALARFPADGSNASHTVAAYARDGESR